MRRTGRWWVLRGAHRGRGHGGSGCVLGLGAWVLVGLCMFLSACRRPLFCDPWRPCRSVWRGPGRATRIAQAHRTRARRNGLRLALGSCVLPGGWLLPVQCTCPARPQQTRCASPVAGARRTRRREAGGGECRTVANNRPGAPDGFAPLHCSLSRRPTWQPPWQGWLPTPYRIRADVHVDRDILSEPHLV